MTTESPPNTHPIQKIKWGQTMLLICYRVFVLIVLLISSVIYFDIDLKCISWHYIIYLKFVPLQLGLSGWNKDQTAWIGEGLNITLQMLANIY